jgi:hypothetical protein
MGERWQAMLDDRRDPERYAETDADAASADAWHARHDVG